MARLAFQGFVMHLRAAWRRYTSAMSQESSSMTSHRPYHENKRGRPPEKAFAEVEAQLGRQFDPTCGAAFLSIKEPVLRAMHELMPDTGVDVPAAVHRPLSPGEKTITQLAPPTPVG